MKVRVFILFAVLLFTLATAINSLATSPEPVGGEERSSIEYANLDGSTLKIFDPTANTYTTWAFPWPAIRDRSGNLVADTSVTEYLNCSTAQLVCADFEELALAVPRIIGGESRWKYEDWTFEKTSCLRRQKSECDRIAVSFGSVAENVVGGFVFDRSSGIEMYFFENRKFKDPTRIYVRVSDKGLFR
jgi:hypothetical protein